jgi:ATP-dependent protease Clp ATPase subunit
MIDIYTDCRSDEGVTVGLVDAIITIARVLRHRDLSGEAVRQALLDIANDEDVRFLLATGTQPDGGDV